MNSAPVNVEAAAQSLGVEVRQAYLDQNISGQIEKLPDGRYRITVNAADVLTRQRFTIAHELGHFVFHRPLIGNGVDDDRAYRSTSAGQYFNTRIGPKQETEANRFAANLLMPKHLIDHLKARGIISTEDLAKALSVSVPAMRVREGKPPYPQPEEDFLDDDDEDHIEIGEPNF
jgi:Zn-dependent peptidase ImmA (M78 family)